MIEKKIMKSNNPATKENMKQKWNYQIPILPEQEDS